MYQKLIVVGRLSRDGEMKFLPNGDPTLSFSMATDRTWNDKGGQRQKETTWWRVTIFGKIAQSLNEYLVKGATVAVEGRLRVDAKTGGPVVYQKRDGSYTSSFEILADQIRLVHSPKWSTSSSNDTGTNYAEDVPF
jgi:single-strand DNA-binding protein